MKYSVPIILFFLLLDSCLDRLDFKVEPTDEQVLVIDGNITDETGPYKVNLFFSSKTTDILNFRKPVVAKQVSIMASDGSSELLTTSGDGIYVTSEDGIKGKIGLSYKIRIELLNGDIFESIPEKLTPVSEIDDLYFQFESFQPSNGPVKYGFRIFMDSSVDSETSKYMRWRYAGTYIGESFPKLHKVNGSASGPPDPLPCSGFIFKGSILQNPTGTPCTCCICWVTQNEDKPHLNDNVILTNGSYKHIEIGYVPVNGLTFLKGKYMLKVEQMSLSREAFEYWKVIKDQKEGLTSLFQPSFGTIKTNLKSLNSNRNALGFFYASSVRKMTKFINNEDIPVIVIPASLSGPAFWNACDKVFENASRTPPPEWK